MKTITKQNNNLSEISDILVKGFDNLFISDEYEILLNLEEIEVVKQTRIEFENEKNTLTDLGKSLKKRQLHPIIVKPINKISKLYRLIIGERRYRAAKIEGLSKLRARVINIRDSEIEDIQFAENIHRKNLTQIEAAQKIQKDLNNLGNIESVLKKHKKSRAWLSKILGLLNLSTQAKRLISENISSDIEVINTVKIIEKINNKAAKSLVDNLKVIRGKKNARKKAIFIKNLVKSSKKYYENNNEDLNEIKRNKINEKYLLTYFIQNNSKIEKIILPKDLCQFLNKLSIDIFDKKISAKSILEKITKEQYKSCKDWLYLFYNAGKISNNFIQEVIYEIRRKKFNTNGYKFFTLSAFLHGSKNRSKFNLLKIFRYLEKNY